MSTPAWRGPSARPCGTAAGRLPGRRARVVPYVLYFDAVRVHDRIRGIDSDEHADRHFRAFRVRVLSGARGWCMMPEGNERRLALPNQPRR